MLEFDFEAFPNLVARRFLGFGSGRLLPFIEPVPWPMVRRKINLSASCHRRVMTVPLVAALKTDFVTAIRLPFALQTPKFVLTHGHFPFHSYGKNNLAG
ncbi:MAG TPA: hypothetical protein VK603_03940 [Candidatus Saccharimonadales bacterium]|nr:hypothetical protein [Candidatus Saccharimonadales bacterium]